METMAGFHESAVVEGVDETRARIQGYEEYGTFVVQFSEIRNDL